MQSQGLVFLTADGGEECCNFPFLFVETWFCYPRYNCRFWLLLRAWKEALPFALSMIGNEIVRPDCHSSSRPLSSWSGFSCWVWLLICLGWLLFHVGLSWSPRTCCHLHQRNFFRDLSHIMVAYLIEDGL